LFSFCNAVFKKSITSISLVAWTPPQKRGGLIGGARKIVCVRKIEEKGRN
jgi:hypothetical protein